MEQRGSFTRKRLRIKRLQIWTVGHSTRSIEEFLALLKPYEIQVVADIRRFPGSRRYPHFGQEQLAGRLTHEAMAYMHFPELGGRRKASRDSPNTAWRNAAFRGYADYMLTSEFEAGIARLLTVARKQRVVLMCAEALWWRCHRALISDFLKVKSIKMTHILGPGKTQEHPFTSAAAVVEGRLSYVLPSQ